MANEFDKDQFLQQAFQNANKLSFTPADFYYLLERFASFAVWNVHNLNRPGELKPLNLENASKYFNVYDRGSCIVADPKNLFDHRRTLEDALKTARAVAGEVYKREWTVELAGFDKMVRAAWIEIQHLINIHGKPLEVLHFSPSIRDVKIYQSQMEARNMPQSTRG